MGEIDTCLFACSEWQVVTVGSLHTRIVCALCIDIEVVWGEKCSLLSIVIMYVVRYCTHVLEHLFNLLNAQLGLQHA